MERDYIHFVVVIFVLGFDVPLIVFIYCMHLNYALISQCVEEAHASVCIGGQEMNAKAGLKLVLILVALA